jgi:phage-related protein
MATLRARLRWRDYRTATGRRPVKEIIDELTDEEAAAIVAAMKEVAEFGLERARHLRGDINEVRAFSERRDFRILFARDAKFVLLSLSVFSKKTAKIPRKELELAESRLPRLAKPRQAPDLAPKP